MKLFVVSPDCASKDQCLQINGMGWGLLEQDVSPDFSSSEQSDFICVSYSWGRGRSPSPIHPPYVVSDRTLPVLVTTIAQRPTCRKIWIDALCVPPPSQPDLRSATLESMGFIYSRAAEVIVVLTPQALPVLEQVRRSSSPLPRAHLDILEAEDWVTRAWTYQEAVNAHRLAITCADSPPGVLVDSMRFFSSLGHALSLLTPENRKRYPRLNGFEDLMADCAVAGYLERSALQVMSIMDVRTQTWPNDHFYAMMGAISTEPARAVERKSPCEAFMALCERKGDYSFVFSSAGRDERAGMRWRPKEEDELKPIIKLSSWGERLRGQVRDGCLVLENIVVLKLGTMPPEVEAWIQRWLEGSCFRPEGYRPDAKTEQAAFEGLQELGFSGSSECLTTEYGLVFPQNRLDPSAQVEVFVSAEIRWTLGAPALVRYRGESGINSDVFSHEPGVFFGDMDSVLTAHVPTTVSLY